MELMWLTDHSMIPQGLICIEAVPGVGNVGKLVADALLEDERATLVARVLHPDLPPHAELEADGLVSPPHLGLWLAPNAAEGHVLVISGNAQPLTPRGQFELARGLLDLLGELGCLRLIVLAGLASEAGDESVFAVFADAAHRDAHPDVPGPDAGGSAGILGLAGLLVSLGPLVGLETVCCVAASPGASVDPTAARRLATAIDTWFGVPLPVAENVTDRLAERLREHLGDENLPALTGEGDELLFYQ